MSLLPYSLFAILSVAACTPVASHDSPSGSDEAGGENNAGESASGGKPRVTGGALPPEEQIRSAPGLEEGNCNAEAAQRFVGQKNDAATVASAVAASGAKTARVIEPDTMVTMDFRGDRLNIRVDDAGKIIAITCG